MSASNPDVTPAAWAAKATTTIALSAVAPGDVIYTSTPAPHRVRHVDVEPDGRTILWVSPSTRVTALYVLGPLGPLSPTTQVKRVTP